MKTFFVGPLRYRALGRNKKTCQHEKPLVPERRAGFGMHTVPWFPLPCGEPAAVVITDGNRSRAYYCAACYRKWRADGPRLSELRGMEMATA